MSQPKNDAHPKEEPAPKADKSAAEKAKLDIASLDLSMEKVEERISPSETNVFDK